MSTPQPQPEIMRLDPNPGIIRYHEPNVPPPVNWTLKPYVAEGSTSQPTEPNAPRQMHHDQSYGRHMRPLGTERDPRPGPLSVTFGGAGDGGGLPNSSTRSSICLIERVPEILFKNEENKHCFTPFLIGLGPYQKDANLRRGQELKNELVSKFYNDDRQHHIGPDYYKVSVVSSEARGYYSTDSTVTISNDQFVLMMFVDGCALLQLISCIVNGDWNGVNIKYYEILLIVHDLFLLENQLPLLVLKQFKGEHEIIDMFDKLIKEIRPTHDVKAWWPLRILDWSRNLCKNVDKSRKSSKDEHPPPHGHAFHLLRRLWEYYIPQEVVVDEKVCSSSKDEVNNWYTFRSAKELKASGIRFSHSKTGHFTDVKYVDLPCLVPISYLCLPPIIIDDSIKSLLLNLAAYEMTAASAQSNNYPVSSYICFMDSLIDHPEDVIELRKGGIILNCLGSDEQVADLFNQVAQHLVPTRRAYQNVKMQIEQHYGNQIKIWITEFLYTRFSSPWAFLAFVGAIAGLVMTYIQTVRG